MTNTSEENNYPKALAISTAIMLLFIALSFFWVIGAFKPLEEVGMGGITVNYGTSLTGMGTDYTSTEEPSVAPNANNKTPDKIVPNTEVTPKPTAEVSDKSIVTQTTEDAVSINTKNKKTNTAPTAATTTKPAKPAINQSALYTGKKNNGTGTGDGNTNTPGNQGKINGDPLAPNYDGDGSGNGGTPIPLSKFNNLIIPQDDGQLTGKIYVKVSVSRNGRVISATAGAKGTTFADNDLYRKCERAVMGANLPALEGGPEVRTVLVVFNFKVK